MVRSVPEATQIIEALLLVCQSESAGDGTPSLKSAVNFIKNLITGASSEIVEIVDSVNESNK